MIVDQSLAQSQTYTRHLIPNLAKSLILIDDIIQGKMSCILFRFYFILFRIKYFSFHS